MIPIVLLPGMGADQRMYERLRRIMPEVIALDFPPHRDDDTLQSYALRLAQTLPSGAWLGGSSFGGMVAAAAAQRAKAHGLILIGSTRYPAQIPMLALSRCMRLMPDRALLSQHAMQAVIRLAFGVTHPQQQQLFATMMQERGLAFVRWAIRAMRTWDGLRDSADTTDATDTSDTRLRIVSIHGGKDRLIPKPSSTHRAIIPDAGHIPALTHPAEVAHWLRVLTADEASKSPSESQEAQRRRVSTMHVHKCRFTR